MHVGRRLIYTGGGTHGSVDLVREKPKAYLYVRRTMNRRGHDSTEREREVVYVTKGVVEAVRSR